MYDNNDNKNPEEQVFNIIGKGFRNCNLKQIITEAIFC